METFITEDGFSAFVTKNKPPCPKGGEHEWDGEEIMSFHNDDMVLKRSQYEALPDDEKNKLNQSMGEVSCSKCGIPYTSYDNPFYSET